MSIQNIINKAQHIEIDRKKFVGQTVSRSQRIKTAERSTAQPWRFKITPPAALMWAESRAFIEVIDMNDRINEYEISLNNNSAMNYITEYQGSMTQSQINNITIYSATTNTITLTNLPSVGSSTVIFAAGDFIQPANSRYPYTVTANVTRGVNTTTNVTLNRPIITSENIVLAGQGIKVGNTCTWQVVVATLPTYALIPNRQVQYTGDFELVEKII